MVPRGGFAGGLMLTRDQLIAEVLETHETFAQACEEMARIELERADLTRQISVTWGEHHGVEAAQLERILELRARWHRGQLTIQEIDMKLTVLNREYRQRFIDNAATETRTHEFEPHTDEASPLCAVCGISLEHHA